MPRMKRKSADHRKRDARQKRESERALMYLPHQKRTLESQDLHNGGVSTGASPQSQNAYTADQIYPCEVCDKTFRSMYALITHNKTHMDEKPYDCEYCAKAFKFQRPLLLHKMLSHTTGLRPFSCAFCNRKFRYPGCVKRHNMLQCEDEFKWPAVQSSDCRTDCVCPYCSQPCHTNNGLLSMYFHIHMYMFRHMMMRGDEKPYVCDCCDQQYNTPNGLQRHKMSFNAALLFPCEYCDRKCETSGDLAKHVASHAEDSMFVCEYCHTACPSSEQLIQHMRTHTGDRLFACEHCNLRCESSFELTKHLLSHEDDGQFGCKYCEMKCKSAFDLTMHELSHTGDTVCVCEICNIKCESFEELVKHRLTHTSDSPIITGVSNDEDLSSSQLQVTEELLPQTPNRHKYRCELCKKVFLLAEYLEKHKRSHITDIHKCDRCSNTFSDSSELAAHILTHETHLCDYCGKQFQGRKSTYFKKHLAIHKKDAKRFPCRYCAERFVLPSQRDHHENAHTGKETFECRVCDKTFSLKYERRRHETTHRGVKFLVQDIF